jgi:hypothetical protein
MVERIADVSPRLKARIAGVLYLIIIVAAMFAELFVRGKLIVYTDAAATAANILAHEPLYRLAGVAMLITISCDTGVALLFYELFKPVGRSIALLAASFRIIMVAIIGGDLINHFAPLVLLKGGQSLAALNAGQLQAQALVYQKLYEEVFTISLVYFGFHCLLIGYLIFRSTFLPRILGVAMAIAGACYVVNSVAVLVAPAFASHLFPYILLEPFLAELSLTLWLIAVGVNAQRWAEQADAAAGAR